MTRPDHERRPDLVPDDDGVYAMPTLVDFLRARLDEQEESASQLDGERWEATTHVGDHYNYGRVLDSRGQPIVDCQVEYLQDGELVARHIARHDPARVLAEVAAKRRIVDEHGPYVVDAAGRTDPTACGVCVDWDQADYDGAPPANAPCRTLRLLALPYDDHPDYRDDWRP